MTQKKQTAVEELFDIIEGVYEYSNNPLLKTILDIKERVLELEKQQIMDAYDKGEFNDGMNETAEQYYTETYNND